MTLWSGNFFAHGDLPNVFNIQRTLVRLVGSAFEQYWSVVYSAQLVDNQV